MRLALLFALVACAKAPPASTLAFKDCTLRDGQNLVALPGECASLDVPEDWEHPDKRITLRIARVAAAGRAAADPLLMVPGGPGQGAVQSFVQMTQALSPIRRKRDVIWIDPRGTGDSAPLTCPKKLEGDDDVAAVLACANKLSGNPRHYHTDFEVRDLEAVRQAMGVSQWNVYGGSYGTRVALQYAKQAPQGLRTLVLDGVLPHDLVLGSTHHVTGEAALVALQARAYPELVADLVALKAKLERQAEGGLTAKSLAGIVRISLYSPEASALLPYAVKAAKGGDYAPFLNLTKLSDGALERSINPFLSFTVGCREDIPFMTEALAPTPFFGLGIARLMQDVCAKWPADKGPAKEAVTSALPALLLSGELDPVTPPEFADRALKTLSRGRHLRVPGTGHITLTSGCVAMLVAKFLDDPDASKLDPKCLAPLQPLPVFTTQDGP